MTKFSTTPEYPQNFALSCMKNVDYQSRSLTTQKRKTQDEKRCVRLDLS